MSIEQKKSTGLENIKLLSQKYANKELLDLIVGVKKAKEKLADFSHKVNEKLGTKEPASKQPAKQAPNVNPVEKTTENKPRKPFVGKVANTDTSKPFIKPVNQNRDRKEGFRNNRDGKPQERKPFIKPVTQFNKPAELDVNIKTKANDRQVGNKRKTKEAPNEKKGLSMRQQMRMGFISQNDDEERLGRRYKSAKKKETTNEQIITQITHAIITSNILTVKTLSEKIGKPVSEIVKKLFLLGMMATINSEIDFETAELVATELGVTLEKKVTETAEEKLSNELNKADEKDLENAVKRPPIVTVMGHVDHGKTSLLDALRKTNIIEGEAGGITQHIGAYMVTLNDEKITFIDTPGHEAFSAMRERGAQVTDVAILVVAADDGLMPQTKEAIRFIKEAKVPMIVAINKIDKPEANLDKVKQQLADNDVLPEEWGGDTICVPISAKFNQNLDKLLEAVLLVAEMAELKANPNRSAVGTIIEAKLDNNKGSLATVLVQNGTLNVGDTVISGVVSGKIRAMQDEKGKAIKKAGPSTPVVILGLSDVPSAGDDLMVVDEKMAKQIVEERKAKAKADKVKKSASLNADELFGRISGKRALNVIIKADVQGSSEALQQSLEHVNNEEVKICVVSASVGNINDNDITLAQASKAIIIAFNTKVDSKSKAACERAGVEVKSYKIIYECLEELQDVIDKMKTPKFAPKTVGHAEVRALFKISSVGLIAGSYVQDGKIIRGAKARVIRKDKVIKETSIDTLKMQKDDAKEVKFGFECGIKLSGFNEVEVGDIIECYIEERIN